MSFRRDVIDTSETDNWNVAKNYSTYIVMQHIYRIKEYEEIARVGTTDIVDEFNITPATKELLQIKALNRMLIELQMLIGNTRFAIKKKEDRPLLLEYKKELDKLSNVISSVARKTFNERDKVETMRINEKPFNFVLKKLIHIKEELLYPLNRSDLIFGSFEEFDPEEYKKKISSDLVSGG